MWIAIPSYNLPVTLQKKTLRMLRKNLVPADKVVVFVASEEQCEEYLQYADPEWCPAFVVGRPGIHAQRSYIHNYWPAGTKVLCLDDDVSNIKRPFQAEMPLLELFERCFAIAERERCALWGIYPSDHGLSLKDRAVVGLTYIIGACYGIVAGSDPLQYADPFTEDFTRSVEFYKRGLGVLRFEGMGPTTRYFKEPGGLQSFRTPESQEAQMVAFAEKYPADATLRKRPGKMTDVRLERKVGRTIQAPFAA